MKKNPLLLMIVFVLLLAGFASAKSFDIRSGAYRNSEIGIEFDIPGGWRETNYNMNGADAVKCYTYQSRKPEMIIFCSRDIWKDMSPFMKVGRSRSDVSIDRIGEGQIEKALESFSLKNGKFTKVSYGGNTYLKTSIKDGDSSSAVGADAVFTVMNGYCYLFIYSDLSGQSRHVEDFEKLLNSTKYMRTVAVTARTVFILSLLIPLFAAMLPTIIYKAAVLKGRLLDRKKARRAIVMLTFLPGAAISAILFLYFENVLPLLVFAVCGIFNYISLSGGMHANVLSYSIEVIPTTSDAESLRDEEDVEKYISE